MSTTPLSVLTLQLQGIVNQLDQITAAQLWKCHDLRAEHCAAIDAHLVNAKHAVAQAHSWCKVVMDQQGELAKAKPPGAA